MKKKEKRKKEEEEKRKKREEEKERKGKKERRKADVFLQKHLQCFMHVPQPPHPPSMSNLFLTILCTLQLRYIA